MLVIARYLVQYDNTLRFFHILYLIHEFLRGLAEWIKSNQKIHPNNINKFVNKRCQYAHKKIQKFQNQGV